MTDFAEIPSSDQIDGVPHPKLSQTLIGQNQAQDQFLEAFNQTRLHHGWLITGPKGVGKATLAWRIAKFLLAHPIKAQDTGPNLFGDVPTIPPQTLDSEIDSPINRQILAGSHPGLCVIRRPYDEKRKAFKQSITVDEVRKLKSFFALSVTDGGRRVVIVDAADDMNVSAANALLKVLEEPPKNTILLLIAHQAARLLPTIRSRCRELRLASLNEEDIAQILTQVGIDIDPNDQIAIGALSAGSAGAAIRLHNLEGLKYYKAIMGIMASVPNLDQSSIMAIGNQFAGKSNSEEFDVFITLIEILMSRLAKTGALGHLPSSSVHIAEPDLLMKLSPNFSAARKWAHLGQEISQRLHHGRAVNLDPAVLILDTFLKLNDCAKRII